MREKLKVPYPCVVEGKYDKIKLDSVIDAPIIVTDGFGVFNDDERKKMFIALSKRTKLIIATDSDGAGLVIRNYFKSIISSEQLIHVYIPSIKGREKRKTAPSKEGTLGLEGIKSELLYQLFLPYAGNDIPVKSGINKNDFYVWGLCGSQNSSHMRKTFCEKLSLPVNLSSNSLLQAVNMLYSREDIEKMLENIKSVK